MRPKSEDLRVALVQNWLHARHLEDGRMRFASIYGALVAGVLLVFGEFNTELGLNLLFFLILLSILGIVMTLKTTSEFKNHMDAIERIVKELHLEGYLALPLARKPKWLWKILRVRYVFLMFYLLMTAIWVLMLLQM